jgi:hypothetical protein
MMENGWRCLRLLGSMKAAYAEEGRGESIHREFRFRYSGLTRTMVPSGSSTVAGARHVTRVV